MVSFGWAFFFFNYQRTAAALTPSLPHHTLAVLKKWGYRQELKASSPALCKELTTAHKDPACSGRPRCSGAVTAFHTPMDENFKSSEYSSVPSTASTEGDLAEFPLMVWVTLYTVTDGSIIG